MAYLPKQIGWSQSSYLLQEISKQLNRLIGVTAAGIVFTTTSTTTTAAPTTTTTTTTSTTTTAP